MRIGHPSDRLHAPYQPFRHQLGEVSVRLGDKMRISHRTGHQSVPERRGPSFHPEEQSDWPEERVPDMAVLLSNQSWQVTPTKCMRPWDTWAACGRMPSRAGRTWPWLENVQWIRIKSSRGNRWSVAKDRVSPGTFYKSIFCKICLIQIIFEGARHVQGRRRTCACQDELPFGCGKDNQRLKAWCWSDYGDSAHCQYSALLSFP